MGLVKVGVDKADGGGTPASDARIEAENCTPDGGDTRECARYWHGSWSRDGDRGLTQPQPTLQVEASSFTFSAPELAIDECREAPPFFHLFFCCRGENYLGPVRVLLGFMSGWSRLAYLWMLGFGSSLSVCLATKASGSARLCEIGNAGPCLRSSAGTTGTKEALDVVSNFGDLAEVAHPTSPLR